VFLEGMKNAHGRGTSKKVKVLKCKKKGTLARNKIEPTEIANCHFATPQNLHVYFELFYPRTKPFNWTKPSNNSFLRKKNTKEITIIFKGPRMVKDGED